jgi:plasmid stability protein
MAEEWRTLVATLNIKNFPDRLHRQLKQQAAREHRSVAQQVVHLLAAHLHPAEQLSILELRGLGKEAWSGIDAAAHVDSERRSWD